jgi:Domain of unknown function (DUF4232)
MTIPPTFDQQLSDFLEDGPIAAPDDTLDSVLAAVPSLPQRRDALRVPWRSASMSGIPKGLVNLAAIAAIVVAAVVLVPRLFPGGIGGPAPASSATATPSPTAGGGTPSPELTPSPAPTATTEPSAPPSVASVPQPCPGGDLAAELQDWQGAAGTRFGTIAVHDVGAADCTVSGTPGLQLVDGQGVVFLDSANLGEPASASPATPLLTLRAGSADMAFLLVGLANYCGASPVLPVRIAIVLPASLGRTVVTVPSGVVVDMAPCNGPTAPTTLHVQASWSGSAP